MLLNIKRAFRFSRQLLSETFLIPRRNRDIIMNELEFSCKILVILITSE